MSEKIFMVIVIFFMTAIGVHAVWGDVYDRQDVYGRESHGTDGSAETYAGEIPPPQGLTDFSDLINGQDFGNVNPDDFRPDKNMGGTVPGASGSSSGGGDDSSGSSSTGSAATSSGSSSGTVNSFPDVAKTPPALTPVPVPYPNLNDQVPSKDKNKEEKIESNASGINTAGNPSGPLRSSSDEESVVAEPQTSSQETKLQLPIKKESKPKDTSVLQKKNISPERSMGKVE